MPFTDHNLKWLKEDLDTYRESGFVKFIESQDLKALVARLEAAEAFCMYVMANDAKSKEFHKAWLKASGKGIRW